MDDLLVQVRELLLGNTPQVRKAARLLFEKARTTQKGVNFDEGKELEFYFNLSVAVLKYPDRVQKMLQFFTEAEDFTDCLVDMNSYLDSGEVPEDCM